MNSLKVIGSCSAYIQRYCIDSNVATLKLIDNPVSLSISNSRLTQWADFSGRRKSWRLCSKTGRWWRATHRTSMCTTGTERSLPQSIRRTDTCKSVVTIRNVIYTLSYRVLAVVSWDWKFFILIVGFVVHPWNSLLDLYFVSDRTTELLGGYHQHMAVFQNLP